MNTKQTIQMLRDYESRNVLFTEPDGSWPIVWEKAKGVMVEDADGKKYLDLTAAFGVAAAGHANPTVVKAGQKQMGTLLHAMGDVHPHALKAELARELSRITSLNGSGSRWLAARPGPSEIQAGKTIFCNSGFEAVEAALKTAVLATKKIGVVAFEGAYHGLGYGALNATHPQHLFRGPFEFAVAGIRAFCVVPEKVIRPGIGGISSAAFFPAGTHRSHFGGTGAGAGRLSDMPLGGFFAVAAKIMR